MASSDLSAPFGDLLRRQRLAAGLTQAELAERAGLSWRGISDLERCVRRRPRHDTVTLLSAALGLDGAERAALEAAARPHLAPPPSAGAASAADATVTPEPDTGGLEAQAVESTPLPSGTVTFLVTGIEGSAHLLQQLGSDRYAALEAEHHRLLRAAFQAHFGREVETQGDGSCIAFSTATGALAAAVQAQRALAAHRWPDGSPVQVRMGLHTGAPLVTQGGYVGLDVHRTARIAAAGHGGQVLLSEATRALVEDTLPADALLRDLGAHRLKDLQRSEHLFQVVLPDLQVDFPPLRMLDRRPHNLPIQLTSFVGRERELAELKPLLLAARLLTLTGPGGTGKTRLALRLAADVLETYAAGVWLVELAPLADPTLVPQTVAASLAVREQPGRSLLDALLDYLRPKTLLLILDNCEHLIATCAQLAETLLRAAPNVRILASSREALGIAGETAYRVLSLPLPDSQQPRDLDALAQNDCVRLFVERAAAAYPHFRLTAKNAPAIAQIGRRLDGIPLAIELAAARVKVLPPDQIAARLDDRFRLLTGGSRTALPRHQTLLSLIEWSHDLLTEAERVLLRQLSVFAGSWSLEGAQAVCGDRLGEAEEVLDTLAHLADKSLVEVEEPFEAAEGRFRLLETIRQFARKKLLASGEAERVRDRHLAFFLGFADQAEPKLRSAEQLAWLERLEREHDNLRTALGWALEGGRSARALRLAGALAYFWELRGYWSEGHKWLVDTLALAERGQAERGAAREPSTPPHPRAPIAWRAKALYGAARIRYAILFEPAASRTIAEASLRLWRELGDTWWMAVALEHLGFMLSGEGDVQTARARLEEGVALARQVEDRWPLAVCLVRLGSFLPLTEHAAARPIREEAVAVARLVGDKSVLSQGLFGLATDTLLEGNLAAAAPTAKEALEQARAIGSVTNIFLSLLVLVIVSCLQGEPAKANGYCIQALALARETGSPQWQLLVPLVFGLVACFGGQPLRGVRLLAATETLLRQRGINIRVEGMRDLMMVKQALDAALATARAQVGPATFETAWAEGQQLTEEQGLALATEIESDERDHA